ncbi:hypothetical protein, partial [Hyphomonas sp.]|uniref:hypothetical protein n=1 Tax=Hyphomonas sp. TaxID=87 RepID=UPI00261B25CF
MSKLRHGEIITRFAAKVEPVGPISGGWRAQKRATLAAPPSKVDVHPALAAQHGADLVAVRIAQIG